MGKRIECVRIGNSHSPVAEADRGGRVHRVHAHRIAQLSYVVDTVAVNVGRVGDEVLLHPVALHGQRLHVLGERGRTGRALLHQDRQLQLRAVHLVLT